jgi:hypothetical protein
LTLTTAIILVISLYQYIHHPPYLMTPTWRTGNSYKNEMATDSKQSTASQTLRVPPFMPMKIGLWFSIPERQFAFTNITNDEEKFTALISCFESQYLGQIEEITMNPPATEQYETLKGELIRILAEIDDDRVQRLVEGEVMGDRKPSQFYHDIKKLASPYASEKFILILWRNRLPDRLRKILDVVDTDVDKLTRAADKIEEAFSQNSRANKITTVTEPPVQTATTNDSLTATINALSRKIDALANDKHRRSRSPLRRQFRRRSRSRKSPRRYNATQKPGICNINHISVRIGDEAALRSR